MHPADAAPYISVIVTARNDNHGVNMLGRMQAFLDSWILQAQRYDLPSEIVVVEWNPPADRPPPFSAVATARARGVLARVPVRLEPVGRLVRHLLHVFRSGVAVAYCGRPVGR